MGTDVLLNVILNVYLMLKDINGMAALCVVLLFVKQPSHPPAMLLAILVEGFY